MYNNEAFQLPGTVTELVEWLNNQLTACTPNGLAHLNHNKKMSCVGLWRMNKKKKNFRKLDFQIIELEIAKIFKTNCTTYEREVLCSF